MMLDLISRFSCIAGDCRSYFMQGFTCKAAWHLACMPTRYSHERQRAQPNRCRDDIRLQNGDIPASNIEGAQAKKKPLEILNETVVERFANEISIVAGEAMTERGEVMFCWVEKSGKRVSGFMDIDSAMAIATERHGMAHH